MVQSSESWRGEVVFHEPFQMPYIEADDVVEQVPAAIANPTLCDTVLPRTSEAGSLRLNAEALYCVDDLRIEVGAAIEDRQARSRVVRKCVPQLLDDPRAGWRFGPIEVEDSSTVMRDDEKAVENAKGERRHGKEIHELTQFPVQRLSSHTGPMPREPRPTELESCSVPSNDGLRLDKNQRLLPATSNSPQHHPKQSVGTDESQLRMPSPQDRKLLAKRHVFQDQIPARAKEPGKCDKQKSQLT